MSSLGWTKRHVATMADVLDAEHESLDAAAEAALDAALSIIEERGKYAVVGQVTATLDDGAIPPDHPNAVKVCLGLFDSDTKANAAAAAMTSNAAGDKLNAWVVPAFYGTPAAWHAERRTHYAELEAKADEKRKAKLIASIEKHHAAMEARAQEIRDIESKAGGQGWPCPRTRVEANKCRHAPKCK